MCVTKGSQTHISIQIWHGWMICDSFHGVHNFRSSALRALSFIREWTKNDISDWYSRSLHLIYKVRYGIQSTVTRHVYLYKGWVRRKTASETNTNRKKEQALRCSRTKLTKWIGFGYLSLDTTWQIPIFLLLITFSNLLKKEHSRCRVHENTTSNPFVLFDAYDTIVFGPRSDKLWRPQNTTQTPLKDIRAAEGGKKTLVMKSMAGGGFFHVDSDELYTFFFGGFPHENTASVVYFIYSNIPVKQILSSTSYN